jgi:RES domain-containing protein
MPSLQVFRVVHEEYEADPLPSRSSSGRFHTKPGVTSYFAQTPATAWKEVSRAPVDPAAFRLVEVAVSIEAIIDLTDDAVRTKFGITGDDLVSPDWAACQRLAEQLRSETVGVWTYSAADTPDGRVLVVFLDRLSEVSELEVVSVSKMEPRP